VWGAYGVGCRSRNGHPFTASILGSSGSSCRISEEMTDWWSLCWAHLPVAGLLTDAAGAVVLGLAFATKKPAAIRAEVPEELATTFGGALFPQGLAVSMVRQRAEARLGLGLLVAGFLAQAAGPLFALGSLTTTHERITTGLLAAAIWGATYFVGWRLYVPWDERRTRRRMDDLSTEEIIEHAMR
jgi:hypothetical protein